jgi:hypothetical protein
LVLSRRETLFLALLDFNYRLGSFLKSCQWFRSHRSEQDRKPTVGGDEDPCMGKK